MPDEPRDYLTEIEECFDSPEAIAANEASIWTERDRYLLDNPGPHWTTKPPIKRGEDDLIGGHFSPPIPRHRPEKDQPMWDDEQLFGAELMVEPARPPSRRAFTKAFEPIPSTVSRATGLWVCQVCRLKPAHVPSEVAWTFKFLGLRGTIVFRSPIACYDCRLFRQERVRELGRRDHRRFWVGVIALFNGQSYPTMRPMLARLLRWRNRLVG